MQALPSGLQTAQVARIVQAVGPLAPPRPRAARRASWRSTATGVCSSGSLFVASSCLLGRARRGRQLIEARRAATRRRASGRAVGGEACVFQVPPAWRRAGPETQAIDWSASEDPPHLAHFGLAELFPEAPGLSEAFNGDADLRRRIRKAMRADLFRPVPKLSEEVNGELRELFVDLEKPHVKAPLADAHSDSRPRPRPLPSLTEAFAERGIALTGEAFAARLLQLGDLLAAGLFSDLVGKPHEGHRWHQDHGEDRWAVMLGFPPENHFEGTGVFSHVIRLSHPLKFPREADGWTSGTPIVVKLQAPEEYIFRPVYRPGQEVLVWKDSACLHSTPDVVNREALWRFM